MQAIPEFETRRMATSGQAGLLARNEAVQPIYEAGSQSRRAYGWQSQTVSPNAAVLSTLATLRDRSRTATRNNGIAKGAIDKLVTNIIGTGIKPMSQAADPTIRKAIQALWTKWTDESDADGLLDFYGQQAQAVRGFLDAGDDYIRLRSRLPGDGLSVPLQLQVLEPELSPYTYNLVTGTTRIRAGIEFDAIGRRVAYWFHPSRPGDLFDYDPSQLRRVPAESVIHLYDPLRAGQLRGVPHLTQALVKLNELRSSTTRRSCVSSSPISSSRSCARWARPTARCIR
jgi:lambda family phage portal protein